MTRRVLSVLSLALLLFGTTPGQPHWPQFRGPRSEGIAASGHHYPTRFGPTLNVLWRTAVGAGHSSPCIWGDRVFLTASSRAALETTCLDRTTGNVLWTSTLPTKALEKTHRVNGAASPTPTSDGERVYVSFGSYGLAAYDFQGKEVWKKPLTMAKNTFGTATSLIVAEDSLVFSRDTDEESYVQVLELKTGAVRWSQDRTGFRSGWSTPVIRPTAKGTEVLVYGAFRLTAYDLQGGQERWSVPGLADEPCITPVLGEGLVYVTSYNMRTNPEVLGLPTYEKLLADYDANKDGTLTREEISANKSVLSRMDADGEGDHPLRGFFRFLDKDKNGLLSEPEWKRMYEWLDGFKHANALMAIRPPEGPGDPKIVWEFGRGVPECPSPLYHDGLVYLVKNGGMASCLDARTGAEKYQGRLGSNGPYYASPVTADGKIYAASARGVITVFATGNELSILARNDLGERIMATPALVEGTVYVRTESHLFAFVEPNK